MVDARRELADARRETAVWQNRFRALLDRTPVPTAICTGTGTVLELNPAFAALLGVSPAHAAGKPIRDFLEPKVIRDFERMDERLRSGRRSRETLTVRWPRGAGELTVQAILGDVFRGLLLTLAPTTSPATAAPSLTDRETEVLRLIASGATTAEAATELGLTPDGVTYHVTRLTTVLKVRNRTALVARAYTLGLLDPTAWP